MKSEFLEENGIKFNRKLNDAITEIESDDNLIIDIKYSSTMTAQGSKHFSAVILYCTKAEYRDLKINKLLDGTEL